jgi:heme oxygenase
MPQAICEQVVFLFASAIKKTISTVECSQFYVCRVRFLRKRAAFLYINYPRIYEENCKIKTF